MQRQLFAPLALVIAGLILAAPVSAVAQSYPNRPIKLVVPSAPGSVADVLARALGPDMTLLLGQPIVVENKAGADQVIGLEYVAKGVPADGYTMIISTLTSTAMLPVIKKGLRFDPIADVPPVINLGEAQIVLTTGLVKPWKTFEELVTFAKANPGKLSYGASSPSVKLPMASIVKDRSMPVTAVAYSQGNQFQLALMSGEIDMGVLTSFNAYNFRDKLRALGISGETRSANFPGVPTFKELGHPNVSGIAWSFNVRAGTPEPVIARLHGVTAQVLKRPSIGPIFERLGLSAIPDSRAAAVERLASEAKFYATVAVGIPID